MSELTQCNYCSHQRSLREAKRNGLKVTILANDWGMGGVSEYTHSKDVNIRKLTKEEREKYSGSWYMELGDHCCC